MRILAILLVLSLGCSGAISGQGVIGNIGAGSVTMCDEGDVEGENCTVLQGAGISIPGAALVGGIVEIGMSILARFLGPLATGPAPAPAPPE